MKPIVQGDHSKDGKKNRNDSFPFTIEKKLGVCFSPHTNI